MCLRSPSVVCIFRCAVYSQYFLAKRALNRSPKNDNSVIIHSPFWHSKLLCFISVEDKINKKTNWSTSGLHNMPRRVKARLWQPNVLAADSDGVFCFSFISLLSLYVPFTKIPGLRTISQEPFVEFRPPGYSPPWLTGRKRLQTHHCGDWPQSGPAAELLSGWKIQETPEGSCLGCPLHYLSSSSHWQCGKRRSGGWQKLFTS